MSLPYAFMAELEEIQDNKIRSFVVEALDNAPEFYSNMNSFIESTKLGINLAKNFLEVLDAQDFPSDVIISAVFLQDLTRYKLDEEDEIEEDHLHPLSVRQELLPLVHLVGGETFDDIMRTIESSHGLSSPIPQVQPTMTDPVYIWILPFVNQLVKEGFHD